MTNLNINIDRVKHGSTEIEGVSRELKAAITRISSVARNLNGAGMNEILGALASVERELERNQRSAKTMSTTLNDIARNYVDAEKKIIGFTNTNSTRVFLDNPVNVGNDADNNSWNHIKEQYGFDDETIEIMKKLYNKIEQEKKTQGAKYRDWLFFRALSQLVYDETGNTDDLKAIAKDKLGVWECGAGNAYDALQAEKFFKDEMGLTDAEFKHLKDQIVTQHSTCGETGQGDFAHMAYVLAGNLNNKWGDVINSWGGAGSTAGWSTDSERKQVIGYLGDATIATNSIFPWNQKVSFGEDDYKADLDAENIAKRTDYSSKKTALDVMDEYYDEMAKSNDEDFRGKEFLTNNDLEDIKKAIDDKKTNFHPKDKYDDTDAFINRLEEIKKNMK